MEEDHTVSVESLMLMAKKIELIEQHTRLITMLQAQLDARIEEINKEIKELEKQDEKQNEDS